MTEMVTSGSMSGERKQSDGLLGESDHERRRLLQAPPVLHAIALLLDSTSNQSLEDLQAIGVRAYISEPKRGRRRWRKKPTARATVYANRRRIRGARGVRLLRRRGEYLERSFAHTYETGGMRRTYLRGHRNILKRVVIHAGGFNLGLIMRRLIGVGTPRGLQGRVAALIATLLSLVRAHRLRLSACALIAPCYRGVTSVNRVAVTLSPAPTCTTGC